MLKQMRLRVILAAMLAFFTVIFLIALLVNVINYAVTTHRADETLTMILSNETRMRDDRGFGAPPPGPFMALPDLEENYMTRFFVVRFDPLGEVISTSTDYIASATQTDAVQYATKVLEGKKDAGYMKEYRYKKLEMKNGTLVVFLNTAREQQYMKTLLALTAFVSCISLLIVFILVTVFSNHAIRPIAKNIERQKQFITDASHELKTPLTSISTSLDVLTSEHGEDEWTDNIRSQTARMSKLVSELVTLSRLDEEVPLPDKESFSLSNAVWEIAEVYEQQAKALGKRFNADIGENVSMYGDKASVQQMLSVLLDNAIRYSDDNGEIRISVFPQRNRAGIEVFNTCHFETIPDVNRLFDRFYRPDASRSTSSGGTGVGLAIAKAVVEAHGGKISASCPSGNTMTIRIDL